MVSDNRYFNLLSVICFKIDGIYPMKNQEIQTAHSKGSLAKGLFVLGGTWAAIFLPVIMIIIAFIIPFGNATTRSYILKVVNTETGKLFLFLMISLPIWCALQKIITILHQHNIHPKREKILTVALALAWAMHAVYILFVRS